MFLNYDEIMALPEGTRVVAQWAGRPGVHKCVVSHDQSSPWTVGRDKNGDVVGEFLWGYPRDRVMLRDEYDELEAARAEANAEFDAEYPEDTFWRQFINRLQDAVLSGTLDETDMSILRQLAESMECFFDVPDEELDS